MFIRNLIYFVSATTILSGCDRICRSFETRDYFSKKRECSDFIPKEKERAERETRELNETIGKAGGLGMHTVEEVCYSKKLNTCVSFTNQKIYLKSQLARDTYSANDILSGSTIKIATRQYTSQNATDAELNDGPYVAEKSELRNSIECAD